ncbi:alcohol dehydrogenase catalytic domain-containing protein [Halosimplex pelagicum]|uniref:Alcohol dehydrogenase catalytic domain-containing protein n=1 Tax=Halosimplex pelagicum TaxID=869886 RepID=A0A7D5PFM2_9EURY|nr:alcohol dehydrogenase catalytic domain-containing protein [Halosimplex pelagicum]QLH83440.1 alcohol dehydrogenase catalytic domain-containing protein [Halosimplex pelagicum]
MRAVVLAEHGEPLELRDVPEPTADPDGVVVETEACGICRSDWHAWQGHGDWVDDRVPTGQVLGHEPVGTVREVGADVETVAVGDRVVVPFSLADGTCPACRAGRQNYCEGATALGFGPAAPGAFAERFHVPAADVNAVHLPEGVSAVAAASMGCRFVTAFEALDATADAGGGDVVVVVGCGGVGLSAVQIAAALGATPVAVDVREAPLELAADIGAAATIDASEVDDPASRVRDRFGGADVSMDALGSTETFRTAVDSLSSGGTHVQVGLTGDDDRGEVALPVDRVVQDDLTVAGSRGMAPRRYDDIFAMVAAGRVDPGALVTDRVALDAVPDRLAAMSEFDTVGVEVVTEF